MVVVVPDPLDILIDIMANRRNMVGLQIEARRTKISSETYQMDDDDDHRQGHPLLLLFGVVAG